MRACVRLLCIVSRAQTNASLAKNIDLICPSLKRARQVPCGWWTAAAPHCTAACRCWWSWCWPARTMSGAASGSRAATGWWRGLLTPPAKRCGCQHEWPWDATRRCCSIIHIHKIPHSTCKSSASLTINTVIAFPFNPVKTICQQAALLWPATEAVLMRSLDSLPDAVRAGDDAARQAGRQLAAAVQVAPPSRLQAVLLLHARNQGRLLTALCQAFEFDREAAPLLLRARCARGKGERSKIGGGPGGGGMHAVYACIAAVLMWCC